MKLLGHHFYKFRQMDMNYDSNLQVIYSQKEKVTTFFGEIFANFRQIISQNKGNFFIHENS